MSFREHLDSREGFSAQEELYYQSMAEQDDSFDDSPDDADYEEMADYFDSLDDGIEEDIYPDYADYEGEYYLDE